jgi:hypothetical protein
MMSLYEYMSMADAELEVKIELPFCPSPDQLKAIDRAMFPYGLTGSCAVASRKPMRPSEKYGMCEICTVECVLLGMRFPSPSVLAQEVSLALKIDPNGLSVSCDGEVSDNSAEYAPDFGRIAAAMTSGRVAKPRSDDPQSLVGEKRISDLIDELGENPDAKATEVDLPEIMTHVGVQEATGDRVRRGYYVVERRDGSIVAKSGPHGVRPKGRLVSS